jgi:hypothetical protein
MIRFLAETSMRQEEVSGWNGRRTALISTRRPNEAPEGAMAQPSNGAYYWQ